MDDIVRSPDWQVLRDKLEAAVRADPSLAWIRERIVDPIELLRLMDREAEAVLEEDTAAQERLSILIHAALPYASLVAAINRPLARMDDAVIDFPTLLDHGQLVFLAIAAARVAPPKKNAAQGFIRVIHGLALAAAGAEALWRLDPATLEVGTIPALLRSLDLGPASDATHVKRYRALFALDQAEIARRKCLGKLLTAPPWVGLFDPEELWSAADGERVTAVARRDDDTVAVTILDPPEEPVQLIAGRRGDTHAVEALTENDELRAAIPAGVKGWIALADPDREAHALELREQLRAILSKYEGEPCLAGTTIPEIPPLSSPPPPPGHNRNRIPQGPPQIVAADITPAIVEPKGTFQLSWSSARAKLVRVADGVTTEEHGPEGSLTRTAPQEFGEYSIILTPIAGKPGEPREVTYRVEKPAKLEKAAHTQSGKTHPLYAERPLDVVVTLDRGSEDGELEVMIQAGEFEERITTDTQTAEFIIPAEEVIPGLSYQVVLLRDGEPIHDLPPVSVDLQVLHSLAIVLITPKTAGAEALNRDTTEAALAEAGLQKGIGAEILHLPWIDDGLAVLPGFPENNEDPSIARLFERLERRALLTTGGEDALWLLAVPGEAAIDRLKGAAAARAIAVATPTGFETVLEEAAKKRDLRPRARSLRLLATIEDRTVRIEHSLVEVRASRAVDATTDLLAISLDGDGKAIEAVPVRALRVQERSTQIAALIPLGEATRAVELRWRTRDRATVHHFTPGRAVSLSAKLDPESPAGESHIIFHAVETRGALVTIYKTASRGPLETLVETVDRCPGLAAFVHSHFQADKLGLLATDGWLSAAERFDHTGSRGPLVKLRRLEGDKFFLDAPANFEVSWRVAGGEAFRTRLLTLRDRSAAVEVEARRAGAAPVIERLPARPPR